MAKVRLNEKSIRRAPPASGQIDLWDDTLPGFGLRISAGGARSYVVMRRVGGRLLRRTIGKAPDPAVLPGTALAEGFLWPAEARREARRLLADMEAGVDPGLKRPIKPKATAALSDDGPDEGTVKWIAEKYLASTLKGGGGRLRSKAELERKLKVDLADWHDRPIREIHKRDIQALVDAKAERSPVAANRLLSFVKRLFAWAVEKDYLEADPARSVRKPSDETPRTRYLDEREIGLFWRACDKLDEAPEEQPAAEGSAGRALQFALLTGQRRGEAIGLRRTELGKLEYKVSDRATGKAAVISGDAWMLPAERTKRGVAHTVPLSALAMQIVDDVLKRADPDGKAFDHVFASGAAGDQPITGWSKLKRRLDELIGREIAGEAGDEYDPKRHDIPEWHIHDLRATCATFLESRLDVPSRVVSRILNHAEGESGRGRSMTARYVRHTWDAEAADALNKWAELVAQLVGLNIVELSRPQGKGKVR